MSALIVIVILASLFLVYFSTSSIDDFESCVAAGNPVIKTYPGQCHAEGQTFVEVIDVIDIIDDYWRIDGIQLGRHEVNGLYGCFGCGEPGSERPICVRPVPEMKVVNETIGRYCNSNFDVVETGRVACLPEQRDVDACIEIYRPVCGTVNVQCIMAPCDSVKETFPNSCKACANPLVSDYVEGEC